LKRETVERVELYADPACKTIVPSIQLYPIYYPLERHPIEIISDLDDTVLRSYTNAFFRRVSTILFTHTERRIMVEFMRNLLIKAREMGMRAYCISRSEENLFHLVTNILSINHLNSVILYLFDYLNYRGLMTRRKKSFKFGQISSILQKSPERRYVLVGDDTQNDIQIYSEIAEQFYGRICSVLIHRTKSRDSNFQRYYHKRLANLKVPVWYFTDETPFETSILKH
jgi:phosphatidate phosphatase APP1